MHGENLKLIWSSYFEFRLYYVAPWSTAQRWLYIQGLPWNTYAKFIVPEIIPTCANPLNRVEVELE